MTWDIHHFYRVGTGKDVGQDMFLATFVTYDKHITSVSMKSGADVAAEWSWPRDNGEKYFCGLNMHSRQTGNSVT